MTTTFKMDSTNFVPSTSAAPFVFGAIRRLFVLCHQNDLEENSCITPPNGASSMLREISLVSVHPMPKGSR